MLNGGEPLGRGEVLFSLTKAFAARHGGPKPALKRVDPPGPGWACITPSGMGTGDLYAEWPPAAPGAPVVGRTEQGEWAEVGRLVRMDAFHEVEYDHTEYCIEVDTYRGERFDIRLRMTSETQRLLEADLARLSAPPDPDALVAALRDLQGLLGRVTCPPRTLTVSVERQLLDAMEDRVGPHFVGQASMLLAQALREGSKAQGSDALEGLTILVLPQARRPVVDAFRDMGLGTGTWNNEILIASLTSYARKTVDDAAQVLTPIIEGVYGRGDVPSARLMLHWFEEEGRNGDRRGARLADDSHAEFWPLGVRL